MLLIFERKIKEALLGRVNLGRELVSLSWAEATGSNGCGELKRKEARTYSDIKK